MRKECIKPNCDCLAIAEKRNDGNPVKSYPCLHADQEAFIRTIADESESPQQAASVSDEQASIKEWFVNELENFKAVKNKEIAELQEIIRQQAARDELLKETKMFMEHIAEGLYHAEYATKITATELLAKYNQLKDK